ncbi:MAG: hypothetical protein COX19_08540 [Desulfobacterales bacterium CG23_combo_of_CG06-09_8_20_14_all_51_8]|nr:MAG: hypothetical protein COX19_08540 [Desulfobacterales bacterium CG23_combo_of_CG06-09_8_20_14_all_51_8]
MGKKLSYHKEVYRACRVAVILSLMVLFTPQFSLAGEKPLTVDECLEIAFTNNLDISQTKKARDEAQFKLDQAHGRKYPTVDINAMSGYTNEVNQMSLGDTTVEAPPLPSGC